MKDSYLFIEDMAGVMERLGGNEGLLRRLLTKFHDTYRDSRIKLFALLDTSDKEEAYRMVHSIKGVSANLGLARLSGLAAALEKRMKAGEFASMQKETEAFLTELETVVTELE